LNRVDVKSKELYKKLKIFGENFLLILTQTSFGLFRTIFEAFSRFVPKTQKITI